MTYHKLTAQIGLCTQWQGWAQPSIVSKCWEFGRMLTLWRMCWVTSSWIGWGWPLTGPLTLRDGLPIVPVSTPSPWTTPIPPTTPGNEGQGAGEGEWGCCCGHTEVNRKVKSSKHKLKGQKTPLGKSGATDMSENRTQLGSTSSTNAPGTWMSKPPPKIHNTN